MRLLAFLLLLAGLPLLTRAQQLPLSVRRLPLPAELADYDNQFSGLAVAGPDLLLLSESRLQDRAEAKLYAVALTDLDQQLRDSTRALPYRKLPLLGLPALRRRMQAAHQDYEGLEALLVRGREVYFSVETATPSPLCYLLKGRLEATAVALDTTFLLPLPKPPAPDGSHIYNAGYEALATQGSQVLAFFEYNAFAGGSYVAQLHPPLTTGPVEKLTFQPLPFRLTDVTALGKSRYVGINFFFKGGGGDAVYRPAEADLPNNRLVRDAKGDYQSYCRLVTLTLGKRGFSWQPLAELPARYWGYNWEGIAAYRGGYFLLNDKYTPARPYQSVLLYVRP